MTSENVLQPRTEGGLTRHLPVQRETFPGRSLALKPLQFSIGLFACALLVNVAGCGPDYKARGVVKGQVTTAKKPLTSGTVMFYAKSGITASARIDPEGNYVLSDAPVGECVVTVTVTPLPRDPSVRSRLKGGGPKIPEMKNPEEANSPTLPSSPSVPKEVVPIDAKYSNPDTSGLTFTVEKREQTFNIELQ